MPKKRILTDDEKEFMKEAWGRIDSYKIGRILKLGNTVLYRYARELGLSKKRQLPGCKGNKKLKEFWKPYLDDLVMKKKPFIVQEVTDDKPKRGWMARYVRKHQEILCTTLLKRGKLIYTDGSRIQAWKLALKSGYLKKNKGYKVRFGKAILGNHLKTTWTNHKSIVVETKREVKMKKQKRTHITPRGYCDTCGGKLYSIYAQKPGISGHRKLQKNYFWCWKCEKIILFEQKVMI